MTNVTPHTFLTPSLEVYPATTVRKEIVTTKCSQIFKLSHPLSWEGSRDHVQPNYFDI